MPMHNICAYIFFSITEIKPSMFLFWCACVSDWFLSSEDALVYLVGLDSQQMDARLIVFQ